MPLDEPGWRKLLTPEQYQAMVQQAGLKMPEAEDHGEAPPTSAPPKPATPQYF